MLSEIFVNIFDDNCHALQPLYKISKNSFLEWFKELEVFIKENNINVYAENALNNFLHLHNFNFIDYNGHFIKEIDNQDDLLKVNNQIRIVDFQSQEILWSNEFYSDIKFYLKKHQLTKPFFIHRKHFINDYLAYK